MGTDLCVTQPKLQIRVPLILDNGRPCISLDRYKTVGLYFGECKPLTTIFIFHLTIYFQVAEKITDLAEKTPRTVKLIKRKLKRSIINHDNYSKTKTMTKSSKR